MTALNLPHLWTPPKWLVEPWSMAHLKKRNGHLVKTASGHLAKCGSSAPCTCPYADTSEGPSSLTMTFSGLTGATRCNNGAAFTVEACGSPVPIVLTRDFTCRWVNGGSLCTNAGQISSIALQLRNTSTLVISACGGESRTITCRWEIGHNIEMYSPGADDVIRIAFDWAKETGTSPLGVYHPVLSPPPSTSYAPNSGATVTIA